ncbi:MAG TPA: Ig-like domain-containing protein [Xanthomonadaceae bacterium]|nr:Ig-like domain-containing protein [Xanthomonadaceae bacterium]
MDITPVNDPPSFTAVDPPTVLEDAGAQSVVDWATFSAGPPNESGQAVLGYFVSNVSNPALFAAPPLVANNGTLTFTAADDANGTSTFDVYVQDDGGTANGGIDVSPTQTFTITVIAVNDPPTFTAGADQQVLEDSGPHLVAGWATDMSAGPPDEAGQVLTFVVTNNTNPGLFSAGPAVDATSGDLSYALIADAFGEAVITLVLMDDGGTANGGDDTSAPHLLTITVIGVNDAPSFTAADPPAVAEDSGMQTVVGWATFSPGPPNESDQNVLGYFVSNVSNPALFAAAPAVANNGTLTYTPADDANGISTFDVFVQDDGGTDNGGIDVSPTQTFTITVNAVNDPPTIVAPATATLDEDTSFAFTGASIISVDDVDAGEGTGELRVELAVNQGVLTLATTAGLTVTGDGTDAVTAEGLIANLNAALDGLLYEPDPDYNGTDTLAILVDDLGNFPPPAEQASASVAITVNAINDPPVLTVPGPQFVGDSDTLEFSAANANAISVDDVDAGSGSLVLDLFISQGGGTLNLNLAALGDLDSHSGDGTDVVQAVGTLTALNAALDGLVFTPVLGATETVILDIDIDDQGNTGAGGPQTDSASITISVDAPPEVVATVPAAGAGEQPTDLTLTVTFSEPVDVTADWFEIGCTMSGTRVPADTVVNSGDDITFTIAPISAFASGETCTLTIFASEVTDQDTIDPPDNMLADFILAFSMDAAPEVVSTVPADGATDQATDIAIEIVFSEPVAVAGNWFQIACSVSGIRNVADTAVATGDDIAWAVTPDTPFTQAESCTMTVFAAQVTDLDGIDPPDNMEADHAFDFSFDAAPEVTAMSPTVADGDQAIDVSITIDFSEDVDIATGAFAVDCGNGAEAITVTPPLPASNVASVSIAPFTFWPDGVVCELTVFAAQVSDSDANDPPDNMETDFNGQFQTDAAPEVINTVPADAGTITAGGTVQVGFSEPVNAGVSAFTLVCDPSGARTFSVSGSGTASLVLTPDTTLPVGETCTVTVIATEIDDVDLIDPPSGMNADHVFSFEVVAVAIPDSYAVTPHLTLNSTVSVLDNDQPSTVNVIGYGTGSDCNQVIPGTPLATTLSGSVTMQADGHFVYAPPAGQRNSADGFCYTITGGSSAAVTLNIANTAFVWFYQQGASGSGTQAAPFGQLLGNVGATTAGDTLLLADGGYNCGVTLQNGQRVVGGASSVNVQTVSGVVPVAGSAHNVLSGNSPTLTAGNVDCFVLDQNNVLRGFTIGNTGSGRGLAGNAFGTLTVSDTVIQGTGQIANLVNGTLAGSLLSVSSTSSAAQGIHFQQVAGSLGLGSTSISGATTQGVLVTQSTANLSFGNTTVAAGTDGVSLQNNSAGARTFGTLAISGGTGTGFLHSAGGGAVGVAGSTSVTNPGGDGMSIQNANAVLNFVGVVVNKNSTAGTGVVLASNGANTIDFGSLGVTTSNGTGVIATASAGTTVNFGALSIASTGSGLVTATGTYNASNGSIAATGGPAILANGTAFGITLATASSTNSSTQGISLTGTSGTLTMNGGSLSGSTGTAFFGSGALGTVTYAGSIAKTGAGRLIDLDGAGAATLTLSGNLSCTGTCGTGAGNAGIRVNARNAGTYTFSGATKTLNSSGANPGVNLTGNTGATVHFTGGGLAVTTAGGTAFNASGGGTVTVQGAANTLNAGNGTALNVVNTNFGAAGLTFQSIASSGGSATGVVLQNTGATGSLTVTGTGTAGSGGTIASKTGANLSTTTGIGVYLENTGNVSLSRMQLNDFSNYAIRGINVVGFTLTNSVVSGSNGNSAADDEGSVRFDNLTGAATISNSSISGGYEDNFNLLNTSGTLNPILFDNVNFGSNNATDGNDSLFIGAYGTSNVNVTVQNSQFTAARGDLFQMSVPGSGSADLIFTGNTLSNNHPGIATGGGGVTISSENESTFTLAIDNNSFRDSIGHAVLIVKGIGTGSLSGSITNNTIGVAATANSGSLEGDGLKVHDSGGNMTVLIGNNQVRQYNNQGIHAQAGAGLAQGGNFHVTVTGNTVANPGNNPAVPNIFQGVHLNNGVTPGDSFQTCMHIGANTITNSGRNGGTDFRVRQRQATTVRLPGYGGAAGDLPAVIAFIQANLVTAATGSAAADFPGTGGGFVGGAACTLP